MPDTYLVNVIPAGLSETNTVPLIKKNGVAITGAANIRFTTFKKNHNALNVGPTDPTTGQPITTGSGSYDSFCTLQWDVLDPAQQTIAANVSQLNKVPGAAWGAANSATRTPVRYTKAVPGDTVQIVNPTTGAAIAGTSFTVPGEWNDVPNATSAYGDSAVQNP